MSSESTTTIRTTPDHTVDNTTPVPAATTTTTTPTPPTQPDPVLSLSALKDRRAHDRATQRALKASDRAKGKKGRMPTSTAAPAKLKVGVWDAWTEAKAADEWPRPSEPVRRLAGTWAREREQRVQVRLADLVRPGRARGAKKGVEHDFEVIPHVRSVIVLDEGAADEGELDEPWEYVSSEGEEDKRAPSYAEILAKAK
ncbi:hypothetical protein DENSPDRAFT_854208 [Dentipellis sp. KUC8613]|nr:hypothetical protein DENSPDRAFT_854208 [Dentipellis sp. KUC8613]